jgi:hypothetical protein
MASTDENIMKNQKTYFRDSAIIQAQFLSSKNLPNRTTWEAWESPYILDSETDIANQRKKRTAQINENYHRLMDKKNEAVEKRKNNEPLPFNIYTK